MEDADIVLPVVDRVKSTKRPVTVRDEKLWLSRLLLRLGFGRLVDDDSDQLARAASLLDVWFGDGRVHKRDRSLVLTLNCRRCLAGAGAWGKAEGVRLVVHFEVMLAAHGCKE